MDWTRNASAVDREESKIDFDGARVRIDYTAGNLDPARGQLLKSWDSSK